MPLEARVKSVLSGDTLVLTHVTNPTAERILSLAYVSAPRLRREDDEVSAIEEGFFFVLFCDPGNLEEGEALSRWGAWLLLGSYLGGLYCGKRTTTKHEFLCCTLSSSWLCLFIYLFVLLLENCDWVLS